MSDTKERNRANRNSWSVEDWQEIKDNLTPALDGIEMGRLDFIGLRQYVYYQRQALLASHERSEAMRQ